MVSLKIKIIAVVAFLCLSVSQSNAQSSDGIPISCGFDWVEFQGLAVTLGRVQEKLDEKDAENWGAPLSEGLIEKQALFVPFRKPETIVGQALVRVSYEADGVAVFASSSIFFVRKGTRIEVDGPMIFTVSSHIENQEEFTEFMKSDPNPTCEIL